VLTSNSSLHLGTSRDMDLKKYLIPAFFSSFAFEIFMTSGIFMNAFFRKNTSQ